MANELQPWVALLTIPFVLSLCYAIIWMTQIVGTDGRLTYEFAGFHYKEHAKFDNTLPTWSTDYVISIVLLFQGLLISKLNTVNRRLQHLILMLLLLYGGSTFLGGIAHYNYDGDIAMLNGSKFYLIWIAVVGCTVVAGGVQGLIGNKKLH